MRRLLIFPALMVLLVSCSKHVDDPNKMPQLRKDQVWLSSVPTGLTIYFAEDTSKSASDESEGWVKLYNRVDNKHYLLSPAFRKGVTPLLLEDISKGNYLVGIEPVECMTLRWGKDGPAGLSPIVDPTISAAALIVDSTIGDASSQLKLFAAGVFKKGAIIYHFTKNDSAGSGVIILTSSYKVSTDPDVRTLYPTGNNYAFDDSLLKHNLNEKGFFGFNFSYEYSDILALLHRGGKITVGDENTQYIVEMSGSNKPSITMKIFVKQNEK